MPKFHYKVQLTDGSIAKRSSYRIYTHLIEISPRTLESFVEEMNNDIAYWEKELNRYADMDIDKTIEDHIQRWAEDMGSRGLEESVFDKILEQYIQAQHNSYNEEWRADGISRCQNHIDRAKQMRDVAIADGHPTIGNYFAGNWCGSLALAEKKMNSQEVRYWTNKGRTARIVPTQSADQPPVYL